VVEGTVTKEFFDHFLIAKKMISVSFIIAQKRIYLSSFLISKNLKRLVGYKLYSVLGEIITCCVWFVLLIFNRSSQAATNTQLIQSSS